MSDRVYLRGWSWIGHALRMGNNMIQVCTTVMTLEPEGKCKVRRPKVTWRRTLEGERRKLVREGWVQLKLLPETEIRGTIAPRPYVPMGMKRIGEMR